MKKALSLVLAVMIALSCASVAFAGNYSAFPAGITELANGDVITTCSIAPGSTVIIPVDATVRIAEGATVALNGTLINNGVLVNDGLLEVNSSLQNTGRVTNNKSIKKIENIYNGETGTIYTLVTIPDTEPANEAHPYHVRVTAAGINESEFFADPDSFYGATDNGIAKPDGDKAYVKYGESIYFTLDFDRAKVDPDKFVVYGNGMRVYRDRGAYKLTPAGEAITVTYGDYVEMNLIKKIKIELPSGNGYRVVAYGMTLEQATEENVEFIYVDYGSDLSFRLDIYEGWQNSHPTITVGGLDPTTQADGSYVTGPDKFGYYTIRNITDDQAANGAYEIYVAGVVADQTQSMILNIMNTIRSIFETIMDIFKSFFDIFKGIGGTTTPIDPSQPTDEVVQPLPSDVVSQ